MAYLRALSKLGNLRPTAHNSRIVLKTPISRCYATPVPPGRRSRFPETVSLERFLLRAKVLSLWRHILRDTLRIEDKMLRAETREQARREFKRHDGVKEVDKIKYFTATGKTEWEMMSRYIDGL